MRSPSLAASSMSWVTKTMVFLMLLLQIEELVLQALPGDGVDGTEGLVHQQDRGIGPEGPGHAHPLALAPRQLVRDSGGRTASGSNPTMLQQLGDPGLGLLLVPARAAGAPRPRCRRPAGAGTGHLAG